MVATGRVGRIRWTSFVILAFSFPGALVPDRGAGAGTMTPTMTRFENIDPSFRFVNGCSSCGQVPGWFHGSRSRAWSFDTASFNRSSGGRATFTFTGTAARWIGFRAPWAGIARVSIDGQFLSELDLFSPTELVQDTIFTAEDLLPGSHTLVIEATGRKNPNATDDAVVVDAVDVSGATPPSSIGARFEESAAELTFTSSWMLGNASRPWSGGTAALSNTSGQQASVQFTGTSIRWIGLRGPDNGVARLTLDGAFQEMVDTYSPTAIEGAVYEATGLAPGKHTLIVEVTDQKNPAAGGTQIVVDAFDVRTRIEENDLFATYAGTWVANDTDGPWSGTSLSRGAGTISRSSSAGATATFTFTGTAVSWIGARGPAYGIATVSIDGHAAGSVDLYSAAAQYQTSVFTRTGLTAGPHTLTISVNGSKNTASTGRLVVIDAFDVTSTPAVPAVQRVQETDPSVAFSGEWPQAGVTFLYSGQNARQATVAGATATLAFDGTAVRWIGERDFDTGVARISIDGAFVAQVDTLTSLQPEYQVALFQTDNLASGHHTLTIQVIGRNNEPAGTSVPRVVIDAFEKY